MKITKRSGIDYTRTLRIMKIINDINNKNIETNMEPAFTKEDAIALRLLEIYCDWQMEVNDPDLPEPVLEVLTHCRQDFLNCIKRSCAVQSYLSIYLDKLAETLFNTKKSLLGLTSDNLIESSHMREKIVAISEVCDFATERILEMGEEIEKDEAEKEASVKEVF